MILSEQSPHPFSIAAWAFIIIEIRIDIYIKSFRFFLFPQVHEPILVTGKATALQADAEAVYAALAAAGVPIHLVLPYDDVSEDVYSWLIELPVAAIGLDFCGVPGAAHGCATAQIIAKHGFPKVRNQSPPFIKKLICILLLFTVGCRPNCVAL